jgi:serine/threonine-protein kinase
VWTPGYASPEQESGALVTTASDVFALAILLREMLTGERVAGTRGTLPEGFKPVELDAELRGILAHAGAHEARARYPTVEAFRADLERWRDGRPVRAAPDTPLYRARKFVRRHRVGALLVAIALVATAVFVWRLDTERSRARDAEAAAEREAENARAAVAFLADALESTSPDRALSAQISVRDLLDGARERLETEFASQPATRQTMQRLLGSLYMSLGEPRIALDLFDAGLKDVVPQSRAAALQIAADEDGRSSALGSLERGEESLAAAKRGQALRERWAPEDAVQQLRSLDQLA